LFDATVATPIFLRGRIVGYVASTAHQVDVGGLGYGTRGSDVFEEGLIIPPLRLCRRGRFDEVVFAFIRANVREPSVVLGDVRAMVAANDVAAQSFGALIDEYELGDFQAAAEEIFARSERVTREAIQAIPDGRYPVTVNLDGDGEPITIQLTLTVDNDRIVADYAGSSPQVRRGLNVVLAYTAGYTAFALRCAIRRDVPNNFGSLKPFEVAAPEGTIVSCRFPAPVSARHMVGQMIPGIVLQALAQAKPDSVIADGSGAVWSTTLKGYTTNGVPFLTHMFHSGGMGARPHADGISTMLYPVGNSAIPIEVTELLAPIVYRLRELRIDSGGAGKFRGGLGQTICLEVTPPPGQCQLSVTGHRLRFPPNGLLGGEPGALGEFSVGELHDIKGPYRELLEHQTLVVEELPGGGGYGSPLERSIEAVEQDVACGYVSREQAHERYGVVMDPRGVADRQATRENRARRRNE
jgi:N-methylhydantoinase B